jgi:hypothetical protein
MGWAFIFSGMPIMGSITPIASAALIAYEGFTQSTNTDLRGTYGGTPSGTGIATFGNPGNGTFVPIAKTPGLTDPNLQTTGNAVAYSYDGDTYPNAGFSDSYWRVTLSNTIASNSVTFVSFLVNSNPGGGDLAIFNPYAGTGSDLPLTIGARNGTYGIFDSEGTNSATSPLAVNTATHLVVVKIDEVSAGRPITMWLDPTSLGGAAPATSYATYNSNWNGAIAGLRIATNLEKTKFDEFRVGTTFADVTPAVPEPASLAVLGLASVSLLLRRRR